MQWQKRVGVLRQHVVTDVSPKSVVPNNCASNEHFDVVIVGSGFSGILCAAFLREDAKVDNLRIFDMNPSIGGVWSAGGVGAYPGAACDVPAYTYLPMLDRTGFVPSKKYVSQREISSYVEMLSDQTGIKDRIRCNRKVTEITLLEDQSSDKVWRVTTVDPRDNSLADVVTCKHVVTANGILSSPRTPEIAGMESFQGESFHTAKWPKNVDLVGKRVAIVGTGASAAQVVTSIAGDVGHLYVFQRTATWCLPRDDQPTPAPLRAAFEAKKGFGELLRAEQTQDLPGRDPEDPTKHIETMQIFKEGFWHAVHDPPTNKKICRMVQAIIDTQVEDPVVARKLRPNYPFFCKRALFIDDYYATFNRPNVTLVDDEGGVARVHETGLETANGTKVLDLDVIIYATGFDSGFMQFKVTGRNKVDLADKFGANETNKFQMTRPESLWGMHVNDFPNFYMMIGPQSLNPLTNVTLLCEEQGKRIAQLVKLMKAKEFRTVEPTAAAVAEWTKMCNASLHGKVWLRCGNWYMKTTKDDEKAGRERSVGMWMESYRDYLAYFRDGKGGSLEEILAFSK